MKKEMRTFTRNAFNSRLITRLTGSHRTKTAVEQVSKKYWMEESHELVLLVFVPNSRKENLDEKEQ